MKTTDQMEQIVEAALIDAGVPYLTDHGKETSSGLDFELTDRGICIEVKRFHSPRIAEQMARADNVIAVQGEAAVRWFADQLRPPVVPSGGRFEERIVEVRSFLNRPPPRSNNSADAFAGAERRIASELAVELYAELQRLQKASKGATDD